MINAKQTPTVKANGEKRSKAGSVRNFGILWDNSKRPHPGQGSVPDIQDYPAHQIKQAWPQPLKAAYGRAQMWARNAPDEALCASVETTYGRRDMWRSRGLYLELAEIEWSNFLALCKRYGINPKTGKAK